MNCPDCKGRMDVIRTYPDPKRHLNFRLLQCLGCGVRRKTVESYVTELNTADIVRGMRKRRRIYKKTRAKRERSEADLAARRALYEQIPAAKRKPKKEPKE